MLVNLTCINWTSVYSEHKNWSQGGSVETGLTVYKGNNKIIELREILQRESQNSQVYKQTKSVNNRKTVKTQ